MHVAVSVGWLGAVVAYLAVAVLVMSSPDVSWLRVGFPLMQQLVWWVIVPFNLLSLASGLASSLASPWGLLRHYWVVTKLIINLVTTVLLLGYTEEINRSAQLAGRPVLAAAELQALREPMNVVHAATALALLLLATVLAVYKPAGLTRRGQRTAAATRASRGTAPLVG